MISSMPSTKFKLNESELTYIPHEKLTFTNGKCLVYKSKKGLMTSFKRFFPYYSSISGIGALIYFNPCMYTLIQSRPYFQLLFLFFG